MCSSTPSMARVRIEPRRALRCGASVPAPVPVPVAWLSWDAWHAWRRRERCVCAMQRMLCEGQKDPETKADITTSRDVGTVRGRRSLHASRHRPDGTGLSSPIDPAYAVCVPTDRPPCHLHPSWCVTGRRARLLADSVPYHCHRRNMSSSSRAHSHTCYECARQAELMLRRWRWYRTLPASHDHVQDGADGRGMSTCRRAG